MVSTPLSLMGECPASHSTRRASCGHAMQRTLPVGNVGCQSPRGVVVLTPRVRRSVVLGAAAEHDLVPGRDRGASLAARRALLDLDGVLGALVLGGGVIGGARSGFLRRLVHRLFQRSARD